VECELATPLKKRSFDKLFRLLFFPLYLLTDMQPSIHSLKTYTNSSALSEYKIPPLTDPAPKEEFVEPDC